MPGDIQTSSPRMDAAFFRAARAYVRRVRQTDRPYGADHPLLEQRRKLLAPYKIQPHAEGTCVWCEKPIREDERPGRWVGPNVFHEVCVQMYLAARGRSKIMGGGRHRWILDKHPCALCGHHRAPHLDHRIPLAVATRLPRHVWLRAWWIGNLQWLCRRCNYRKTRQDHRMVAVLRAMDAARLQTQQTSGVSSADRKEKSQLWKRMQKKKAMLLMWIGRNPGHTVSTAAFYGGGGAFYPNYARIASGQVQRVLDLDFERLIEIRGRSATKGRCFITAAGRGALDNLGDKERERYERSFARREQSYKARRSA